MRALAICLALVATPATALSILPVCDPADNTIENAFRQFDGYAKKVVMVHGRFTPGTATGETDLSGDGTIVQRTYTGAFHGKSATATGFNARFSARVEIQQLCEQGTCFPRFDGSDHLVFLQKTDRGYLFEASEGVCVQSGFANPTFTDLAQAVTCLNGGCR